MVGMEARSDSRAFLNTQLSNGGGTAYAACIHNMSAKSGTVQDLKMTSHTRCDTNRSFPVVNFLAIELPISYDVYALRKQTTPYACSRPRSISRLGI